MFGFEVWISAAAISVAFATNATDPKNKLDQRTFGFFDSGLNMRNVDADYEKPIVSYHRKVHLGRISRNPRPRIF